MIALSNQYSPYQWWSVNWLSLEQPSECLVPTQGTSTGLCLSRLILCEQDSNQVSKRLSYNNMEHRPTFKSKSNHHWIHSGLRQYKCNTMIIPQVIIPCSYTMSQQSIKPNLFILWFHIPNLRPYEGPPSHRHGSFIFKHIIGSSLSNPRFMSSNFH